MSLLCTIFEGLRCQLESENIFYEIILLCVEHILKFMAHRLSMRLLRVFHVRWCSSRTEHFLCFGQSNIMAKSVWSEVSVEVRLSLWEHPSVGAVSPIISAFLNPFSSVSLHFEDKVTSNYASDLWWLETTCEWNTSSSVSDKEHLVSRVHKRENS